MRSSKTKRLNGFTVVELTVALSVSAAVLVTGYELFTALKTVGEKQNQSTVELWEMTDALEQISEDLMHAVPKTYGQEILFAGANPAFEFEEFKLLKFYSFWVSDVFTEVSGVRAIYRIEYKLVKEKDLIRLYRVATPVLGSNQLSDGETTKLICSNVEEVNIFFHDGRRLERSFSSKQHLPAYVELELTAYGQSWPLAVSVPCGIASMERGL